MEKDTDFEDFIKPKAKSKYPYTSNDPDDRIQIIKNFYEKRLEVLKEDVKLVYQRARLPQLQSIKVYALALTQTWKDRF